jgi:cellulose biosynthesis protein BcsQ
MKSVVFFNNKGGVGKTSLLYHTAFALADAGKNVVVADLDPQANLTSFFLDDDEIDEVWKNPAVGGPTVYSALEPLLRGTGDIDAFRARKVDGEQRLRLIPGDLRLAEIEDELSAQWPNSLQEGLTRERAMRVTTAFHRMLTEVKKQHAVDIALIDVGPNFGAINRCALIAADFVMIPLGADLFSIRGLKNLGPKLSSWRQQWSLRKAAAPANEQAALPRGAMEPLGFTVNMFNVSRGDPAEAFKHWIDQAPEAFADTFNRRDPKDHLGSIKNFHSQMAVAQEKRKPIFRVNKTREAKDVAELFQKLAVDLTERIEALEAHD